MDIKSAVIKLACDSDLRHKFTRSFPTSLLDDYFISYNGAVLHRDELSGLNALNYFINGLGLVGQAIKSIK